MPYIFIHGWGFDDRVWSQMLSHFKSADYSTVNMGFIGERSPLPDMDGAVVVGHSLGLMWALKNMKQNMKRDPRALISICSFTRFSESESGSDLSRRKLQHMRQRLDLDPGALMQDFWNSWEVSDLYKDSVIHPSVLKDGLDWIGQWDVGPAVDKLSCPILALAAQDDTVVIPKMTQKSWGKRATQMEWSESGGHILPMTRPDWCAEHIQRFVGGL